MPSKGPCQPKAGEDSACSACEKQRDRRLSEGVPTRKPLGGAAVSPQPLRTHLQQLLGREAPLLVRLQAALEEVPQQSRQAPGLLQLRGPVLPDQSPSLQEKQTQRSASFPHTHECSQRPRVLSPSSRGSFLPGTDAAAQSSFLYASQKNQILMQPQPLQLPNGLALRLNFFGLTLPVGTSIRNSPFCFS